MRELRRGSVSTSTSRQVEGEDRDDEDRGADVNLHAAGLRARAGATSGQRAFPDPVGATVEALGLERSRPLVSKKKRAPARRFTARTMTAR